VGVYPLKDNNGGFKREAALHFNDDAAGAAPLRPQLLVQGPQPHDVYAVWPHASVTPSLDASPKKTHTTNPATLTAGGRLILPFPSLPF
jgi:hypothetical protein